jgi:hypothetical protein
MGQKYQEGMNTLSRQPQPERVKYETTRAGKSSEDIAVQNLEPWHHQAAWRHGH